MGLDMIAWCAGFIDGEGSVRLVRNAQTYAPCIEATQATHRGPLDRLQLILGGRVVQQNRRTVSGKAAVLRALREVDPARADLVARDLWEGWEAGHIPGMEVWEWLTEAGVDPEQVADVYRHRAARIAAETGTTEGMLAASDDAGSTR